MSERVGGDATERLNDRACDDVIDAVAADEISEAEAKVLLHRAWADDEDDDLWWADD